MDNGRTREVGGGWRDACRGDAGEVTATVVVFPVVLLTILFVVQFMIIFYARQVLSGATRDGAVAAARRGSSPGEGEAVADGLISSSSGSLFASETTSASQSGRTVTVTAVGQVRSLLPFVRPFTIRATGSASTETFNPQGATP